MMHPKGSFLLIAVVVIVLCAAGAFYLGFRPSVRDVPDVLPSVEVPERPDPASIRGSTTFGSVEMIFGVPASALAEAFGGAGALAAEIRAKDVETAYTGRTGALEVGTDSVRLFVAAWKRLPFDPKPTTALPAKAAAILLSRNLDSATADLVRARALPGDSGSGVRGAAEPSAPGAVVSVSIRPAAREVRGRTTFGDLWAWGLPRERVREALGCLEPGTDDQVVRDFCVASGVRFSEVRARLQKLADDLTNP